MSRIEDVHGSLHPSAPGPLERRQTLPIEIHAAITGVLDEFGIQHDYQLGAFHHTGKTVYEEFLSDKLSRLVIESTFPAIGTESVSHYTKFPVFDSILRTREFRLYSILKRFKEDELTSFFASFGYDPNAASARRDECEAEARDLFYASFTQLKDSPELWDLFGDKGMGVRLDFRVAPKSADFRRLEYSAAPLLKKLLSRVREFDGCEFLVMGQFENSTTLRLVLKGCYRVVQVCLEGKSGNGEDRCHYRDCHSDRDVGTVNLFGYPLHFLTDAIQFGIVGL